MLRRIITLITALTLAMSGAGLAVALAGPAQAASCTQKTGTAKTDPNTGWSWTTWWICGNDGGAKMYLDANTGTLTGYMDSTSSWFVCWRRGAQHAGGNNVWYYSQGDRAASGQSGRRAWGFMPAVNVWTSVDPWTGMAECPSSTPPPPTTTPPTSTTPARSNGYKTLILLHGYKLGYAVDCDSYWGGGNVVPYLQNRGWANVVKITYYSRGGEGCLRIPGASNTNRSIEDLGADFAWYIYDTYSSKGRPVDVIAHSMGGLVTRVAIAGTATRKTTASGRVFPPYLYIEDVATLSTPHEGTRIDGTGVCGQCTEMAPGSSFLRNWIVRPSGQRVGYDNPQSKMGTDWSALGSGDDWTVNTGSALNISATYHFGHKYIYLSGSGLDHGQMANITGGSYAMKYCDYNLPCDMSNWGNWNQLNTAAGPVGIAANAVYYSSSW